MAPTDSRVAKPERRWGCCRGTPNMLANVHFRYIYYVWRSRQCQSVVAGCR